MIDDSARSDVFVLFGAPSSGAASTCDHDGPHNLCCGERHDRRG
jgi:hypothetical protein